MSAHRAVGGNRFPTSSRVGSLSLTVRTRNANADNLLRIRRLVGKDTFTALITGVSGSRLAAINCRLISLAAARPIDTESSVRSCERFPIEFQGLRGFQTCRHQGKAARNAAQRKRGLAARRSGAAVVAVGPVNRGEDFAAPLAYLISDVKQALSLRRGDPRESPVNQAKLRRVIGMDLYQRLLAMARDPPELY